MKNEEEIFLNHLQNKGIEIIELTSDEEDIYRQEWFRRIVPIDKQQKAIDCYCFDKDGYKGYLWHAFSYEILDFIEGSKAKEAFNIKPKQDVILLVNVGDITSCKIMNISNITAEMIDLLSDVILTDCNFEWTYVKTHEISCGPYFHFINRNE